MNGEDEEDINPDEVCNKTW